jgi:peptidoglycan/LPS O-acetylase OafA/YrhL
MSGDGSGREPPTGQLVIPSLDGLRALSFLLVFAGHTGAPWIPAGFGVTVFFFLSGYLITTLMHIELTRTGKIDFKHFYLRRALRIWPPFYIVLLGGIILTLSGQLPGTLHWQPILAQVCHVYNYWTIAQDWKNVVPGSGVYWSLAVEEHFYLAFPALLLLFHNAKLSPRQMHSSLLVLCGVVLAWRCIEVFALDANPAHIFVATDSRVDSILFGCGLALWRNPALERRDTRITPNTRELLVCLAALCTLLVTFVAREEWFRNTIRYTLQGVALTPLFSFVIRFHSWGVVRVLNHPLPRFLGVLSYSMYLLHHTLLALATAWFPTLGWPARAGLTLVGCYATAHLMYRFVEKPCAALRRSLSAPALQPAR